MGAHRGRWHLAVRVVLDCASPRASSSSGDRAMSDGGVMWRSHGARVGGVALGALAVTATRGDSEFIAATGWIGVQGRRCRGQ